VLIVYVGFVQSGNCRKYNFEARPLGRTTNATKHIELSMLADMALVSRMQVKFQDLPGLCMRTLSTAVDALTEGDEGPGTYTLTEDAVRAHCTALLVSPARNEHRRRFHPKPTENSQLQWSKKI